MNRSRILDCIFWCSFFSYSHCNNLETVQLSCKADSYTDYHYAGAGAATLSLTSQPKPSGVYCPGPVTFTCVGTEIGTLFWIVNDRTLATYGYRDDDNFPLTLPLNSPPAGATVQIINASSARNLLNVTSIFSVDDVTVLNRSYVQCEEVLIATEPFNIFVDSIEGTNSYNDDYYRAWNSCYSLFSVPPSGSFTSAFLPSPGGANISLQWSPSFTSQYAVEKYRVSVNPDPSSCSSDQVSPSEDYSCSGLVLGTRYTFTVSAINCGDQEGERDEFDVLLCGLSIVICKYNTHYSYLGNEKIEGIFLFLYYAGLHCSSRNLVNFHSLHRVHVHWGHKVLQPPARTSM